MMLKEAIEFLVKRGEQSTHWQPIDIADDEFAYFVDHKGDKQMVGKPQPHRNHEARSIHTIADYLSACGESPQIWYDRENITAIIESDNPRNRIRFDFESSLQFKTLRASKDFLNSIKAPALCDLIRSTFDGCILNQAELLEIFSRVNFKTTEQAEVVTQRQQRSMGRNIESQISGLKAIPETLTFTIPAFENHLKAKKYSFVATLLCNPESESFTIVPMPDAIEKVYVAAEKDTHEMILEAVKEDIPVFYGQPHFLPHGQ